VVITDAAAEGEMVFVRRKFGALASDQRDLPAWLAEHEVREVVMESTAQYSRCGGSWRSAGCIWHRRSPIGHRADGKEISGMPNSWRAGTWRGN
jgi:hypothetical protein